MVSTDASATTAAGTRQNVLSSLDEGRLAGQSRGGLLSADSTGACHDLAQAIERDGMDDAIVDAGRGDGLAECVQNRLFRRVGDRFEEEAHGRIGHRLDGQ